MERSKPSTTVDVNASNEYASIFYLVDSETFTTHPSPSAPDRPVGLHLAKTPYQKDCWDIFLLFPIGKMNHMNGHFIPNSNLLPICKLRGLECFFFVFF